MLYGSPTGGKTSFVESSKGAGLVIGDTDVLIQEVAPTWFEQKLWRVKTGLSQLLNELWWLCALGQITAHPVDDVDVYVTNLNVDDPGGSDAERPYVKGMAFVRKRKDDVLLLTEGRGDKIPPSLVSKWYDEGFPVGGYLDTIHLETGEFMSDFYHDIYTLVGKFRSGESLSDFYLTSPSTWEDFHFMEEEDKVLAMDGSVFYQARWLRGEIIEHAESIRRYLNTKTEDDRRDTFFEFFDALNAVAKWGDAFAELAPLEFNCGSDLEIFLARCEAFSTAGHSWSGDAFLAEHNADSIEKGRVVLLTDFTQVQDVCRRCLSIFRPRRSSVSIRQIIGM